MLAEVAGMLCELGIETNTKDVRDMVVAANAHANNKISFDEFCAVMNSAYCKSHGTELSQIARASVRCMHVCLCR